MAAKYLLVVPALAAALLVLQMSGLQAAEESLSDRGSNDENPVWEELLSFAVANENKTEATVIESGNPNLNVNALYSDNGKLVVASNIMQSLKANASPLIILDGKIISYEEFTMINKTTAFGAITVLDGKNATDKYGEKAEDGVIILSSKKEKNSVKDPVAYELIPNYKTRQGTTYAPEGNIIPKATLVSDDFQVEVYDSGEDWIRLSPTVNQSGNKPLVFVDGKEIRYEDHNSISPESVQSISILKDQSAITAYGEKAANGVIIVTTKTGAATDSNPVSGVVTNADGKPLPGVSVIVKGTTTGSVTDMNGKYLLNVPDQAILQFSFVGMASQEIAVGNQQVINVVMVKDEVIVIAYGSMNRETQIKTEIDNFRIRSLGGNDNPLIIVDGKEFDGNLSSLDPNQIYSMTVLKDASSTAAYGEKGKKGRGFANYKKSGN